MHIFIECLIYHSDFVGLNHSVLSGHYCDVGTISSIERVEYEAGSLQWFLFTGPKKRIRLLTVYKLLLSRYHSHCNSSDFWSEVKKHHCNDLAFCVYLIALELQNYVAYGQKLTVETLKYSTLTLNYVQ